MKNKAQTRDVRNLLLAITKLEASMGAYQDIEGLDALSKVDLYVLLDTAEALQHDAANVAMLCRAGLTIEGTTRPVPR